MKKILLSLWYKVPLTIKDVWYNYAAYCRDEKILPEIFDEDKKYIPISRDRLYVMRELENGKKAYYKICDIHVKQGSDWLYDSDQYNVDFLLHSVK